MEKSKKSTKFLTTIGSLILVFIRSLFGTVFLLTSVGNMDKSRVKTGSGQSVLQLMALLLCCLAGVRAAPEGLESKIVGGVNTQIRHFPYLVRLEHYNNFFCGGSLVSRSCVVTAAHCVYDKRASSIIVVGGSSTLSYWPVWRKLLNIYISPQFNYRNLNMDVAVLQMSSDMVGSNISPISLSTAPLYEGYTIVVSGWGMLSESSPMSYQMQSTTIQLISFANCKRIYRGWQELTSAMLCAGGRGHKDHCWGDSGGPAVFNGQLVAIVSWGYGCGRYGYPGVYARISEVISFIRGVPGLENL